MGFKDKLGKGKYNNKYNSSENDITIMQPLKPGKDYTNALSQ